jgi:hypothetical protein
MISLPKSNSGEYSGLIDLDLYDSSNCTSLATQAATGRHLRVLSDNSEAEAIEVCLCEDGYTAWLPVSQIDKLEPTSQVYRAIDLDRSEIEILLPDIIAFSLAAMKVPNYYLWGGTIGPNYDCSGLMQAAFKAYGIWLPRDSYQQVDFTKKINLEELLPGDLIFFATKEQTRVNHVALYLGQGYYIHSSGKETGRNGIGIDRLSEGGDRVSEYYYQYLWGCGRVMSSYNPNLIVAR